MIIGLGVDIVELRRIERSFSRFGPALCAKILTEHEQAMLPAHPVPYLAARFAAKEAAVKALGTGFQNGITAHDIEVRSTHSGKPCLHFYNKALEQYQALGAAASHVSLTHGRDHAVAVVILEQ
ncbi:holo-[acyl-carrier-protein] synthase [Desulfovibrionales bacterium]